MKTLLLLCALAVGLAGCQWTATDTKVCVKGKLWRVYMETNFFGIVRFEA